MTNKETKLSVIKRILKNVYKFFSDDTTYFAASLSFFTIFAVLPIIALILALVSKLEQFNQYFDLFTLYILDFINPSHSDSLINLFQGFIDNSDKLGFIGIIYMMFVFTMFFKDYEYIVNKIHKTKRKSIYISFVFYLSFLILLPVVFTIYILLTSFYQNSNFDIFLTSLFEWTIFFLLFKLTINKYITSKAALVSSIVTLIFLSITKSLFVYYTIYNQTYATIYGSVSAVLFAFLWIYVSWIIYLYGIKLCHVININELENI